MIYWKFAHLLTKLTKNLITRPILETPIKSSKFLTTSYEYSYYESANNYVGDSVNDAKAVVVFAATIGKWFKLSGGGTTVEYAA